MRHPPFAFHNTDIVGHDRHSSVSAVRNRLRPICCGRRLTDMGFIDIHNMTAGGDRRGKTCV